MKNQNTTSPVLIARKKLLTQALYMSHSGSSFDYRCIAVTALHTLCAFLLECFTIFRGREAAQLICLSALRFS